MYNLLKTYCINYPNTVPIRFLSFFFSRVFHHYLLYKYILYSNLFHNHHYQVYHFLPIQNYIHPQHNSILPLFTFKSILFHGVLRAFLFILYPQRANYNGFFHSHLYYGANLIFFMDHSHQYYIIFFHILY